MKRRSFISRYSLIVILILVIALSACVRPIPGSESSTDSEEPSPTTIVIPTSLPIAEPTSEPTTAPDAVVTAEPEGDTQSDASPTEVPTDSGSATVEPEPTAKPRDTETEYTVKAGDTLGQIAEDFDITLEELVAANGITNIHSLDVGQVLVIPVPGTVSTTPPADTETGERTHIVKAGENLFRIGLAYGFTVEELADYNNIADPTRIEVGQEILIPPDN